LLGSGESDAPESDSHRRQAKGQGWLALNTFYCGHNRSPATALVAVEIPIGFLRSLPSPAAGFQRSSRNDGPVDRLPNRQLEV